MNHHQWITDFLEKEKISFSIKPTHDKFNRLGQLIHIEKSYKEIILVIELTIAVRAKYITFWLQKKDINEVILGYINLHLNEEEIKKCLNLSEILRLFLMYDLSLTFRYTEDVQDFFIEQDFSCVYRFPKKILHPKYLKKYNELLELSDIGL